MRSRAPNWSNRADWHRCGGRAVDRGVRAFFFWAPVWPARVEAEWTTDHLLRRRLEMHYRNLNANRHESGQSIIESAILVPFLIVLLFNAVNIGYYFTVALHLSTAPRQGAEYSIQGPVSQLQGNLPA